VKYFDHVHILAMQLSKMIQMGDFYLGISCEVMLPSACSFIVDGSLSYV
jgi:hypothetical protein